MSIFKRTFEEPNLSNNWRCPICETAEIKPVVLMPVNGTEDGGIVQARQMHADCLQYGVSGLLNQNRGAR